MLQFQLHYHSFHSLWSFYNFWYVCVVYIVARTGENEDWKKKKEEEPRCTYKKKREKKACGIWSQFYADMMNFDMILLMRFFLYPAYSAFSKGNQFLENFSVFFFRSFFFSGTLNLLGFFIIVINHTYFQILFYYLWSW